jgi:hypothetical protein
MLLVELVDRQQGGMSKSNDDILSGTTASTKPAFAASEALNVLLAKIAGTAA